MASGEKEVKDCIQCYCTSAKNNIKTRQLGVINDPLGQKHTIPLVAITNFT